MDNIEFVASPTVLVGVFVGGCVLLLFYILKLFRIEHEHEEKAKSDQSSNYQHSQSKKEKIKKKPIRDETSRNKQKFTSPWLLTSLKGHTGAVLNIDYSANGKYLATCGEEDPDPDKMSTSSSSFSSSSSDKENRHPRRNGNGGSSSEEPSPRTTKGLSRRQRKNRKREDNSESKPPTNNSTKKPASSKPQKSANASKSKITCYTQVPLQPQGFQMNFSDYVFITFLRNFFLTDQQLYNYGYPVGNYKDIAVFFSYNPLSQRRRSRELDVNAREFLPRTIFEGSSDASSDSNSDDWSGSESEVFTRSRVEMPSIGVERICARCSRGFFVTSNEYLTQERCVHHWGKLVYSGEHGTRLFSCCGARAGAPGCSTARLHVWSGVTDGINGPYEGFVRTTTSTKKKEAVYALDCEMCYTIAGLEATKVTVVGADGKCVYDSYVRPENEIVDYNTRYSGITERLLERQGCRRLKQVQRDLLAMIGAETVLIGHGLENDLRALKMIHKCVVDTAVVFPHGNGFPYRKSLKVLVQTFLKREIQSGDKGHDSYEDARACMELMVNKVCREFMVPVFWTKSN